MISIPNFKLHSLAVGLNHVRSFSINSVSGLIADYILGECGANSALPIGHYERVTLSQSQIRLKDEDGINLFDSTWDQMTITEKALNRGDELSNYKETIQRAKVIFPKVLKLLNNPYAKFLGIVCTFVMEHPTDEQSRFCHPAADFFSNRMLPYKMNKNEVTSNMSLHHTYRSKIPSSLVSKSVDDYYNINVHFRTEVATNIWKDEKKPKDDVKVEVEKVSVISFDIQRVFDPRRKFDIKTFDNHLKFFNKHLSERIVHILKEINFVA